MRHFEASRRLPLDLAAADADHTARMGRLQERGRLIAFLESRARAGFAAYGAYCFVLARFSRM